MIARLKAQAGWAVVSVMAVMGIVLSLGFVALSAVDSLQRSTGRERVREAVFNVAEAALHSEVRALSERWPSGPELSLPRECSPVVTTPGCPAPASLRQFFGGTSFVSNWGWSVSVRDNQAAAATYYSRAVLDATPCPGGVAPCTWDADRDGKLWVRAEGVVNGQRRAVVGMARQQAVRIPLPRKVVVGGWFHTNNLGLKTIVDTRGCATTARPSGACSTAQPAPIAVRCTPTAPGPTDPCLSYRDLQVAPEAFEAYSGNVLSPRAIEQVRARARQLGTYFTSCPSAAQLTGELVFIEGVSCAYVTGVFNSPQAPGIVVVERGTLTLGGNTVFYGALIGTNRLPPPADSAAIITLTGTALVEGAIFVDGSGGVVAGASGLNVSFDSNALGRLMGASATILEFNSFREVPVRG